MAHQHRTSLATASHCAPSFSATGRRCLEPTCHTTAQQTLSTQDPSLPQDGDADETVATGEGAAAAENNNHAAVSDTETETETETETDTETETETERGYCDGGGC